MGLTTLSAQLAFILGGKLLKIVIKCKICFLNNLRAFFLKIYIFETVTFFPRLMLTQSTHFFSDSAFL